MKCLVSTHIYFIWVLQSYLFYQRNRNIVYGGERDTLMSAVSKNFGHVRDMVDSYNKMFSSSELVL